MENNLKTEHKDCSTCNVDIRPKAGKEEPVLNILVVGDQQWINKHQKLIKILEKTYTLEYKTEIIDRSKISVISHRQDSFWDKLCGK